MKRRKRQTKAERAAEIHAKGDAEAMMAGSIFYKPDGTVLHAGHLIPKETVEALTKPPVDEDAAFADAGDESENVVAIATGENYDPNWRPTESPSEGATRNDPGEKGTVEEMLSTVVLTNKDGKVFHVGKCVGNPPPGGPHPDITKGQP